MATIRSNIPNEPKGRIVELDGINYHFKPDAEGVNVCVVEERTHVKRLLGIDGGEPYELHDAALKNTIKPKIVVAVGTKAKAGDPFANPTTEIVGDNVPPPRDAQIAATPPDDAPPVPRVPKAAKPKAKKK